MLDLNCTAPQKVLPHQRSSRTWVPQLLLSQLLLSQLLPSCILVLQLLLSQLLLSEPLLSCSRLPTATPAS